MHTLRREWPLDLYKLVVGVFVFLSPWIFAFAYGLARTDAWVSGLILMAASTAALVAFHDWEEWLALAVGLWLIAAPWILRMPHLAAKIHIGAGLVCVYLAVLELWMLHYNAPEDGRRRY